MTGFRQLLLLFCFELNYYLVKRAVLLLIDMKAEFSCIRIWPDTNAVIALVPGLLYTSTKCDYMQPAGVSVQSFRDIPKIQIPEWVCGERPCSVLHPSLTALHNLIARMEQPMQTVQELIALVWRQLWGAWGTFPLQILSSPALCSPAPHHQDWTKQMNMGILKGNQVSNIWPCCSVWSRFWTFFISEVTSCSSHLVVLGCPKNSEVFCYLSCCHIPLKSQTHIWSLRHCEWWPSGFWSFFSKPVVSISTSAGPKTFTALLGSLPFPSL